jgi:hypothetical protein
LAAGAGPVLAAGAGDQRKGDDDDRCPNHAGWTSRGALAFPRGNQLP